MVCRVALWLDLAVMHSDVLSLDFAVMHSDVVVKPRPCSKQKSCSKALLLGVAISL